MSAYKDNDKWVVRFRAYDTNGNCKSVTKRGFATKQEALAYEYEYKYRYYQAGTTAKLEEVINDYLSDLKTRVLPSSYNNRQPLIRKYILTPLGDMPLSDIDENQMLIWQNNLLAYRDESTGQPHSLTYLNYVVNVMNAILDFAHTKYPAFHNPLTKIRAIKHVEPVDRSIDRWSAEEYQRFKSAIRDRGETVELLFNTMYFIGLTEGETAALRAGDVDLNENTLNIHHCRYPRIVKIPSELVEAYAEIMKDRVDPDELLFPVSKTERHRIFHRGMSDKDLPKITIADLRASYIVNMIEAGYSTSEISVRTGIGMGTLAERYEEFFRKQSQLISK